MPFVKIHRVKQLADAARAYRIFVDDEEKDEIRRGETADFFVTEGNHRIQLMIDWCSSPEIEFTAGAEEAVEFECGNNTKGFFTMYYVLFAPHDYLWLKKR
jgi:hypothetical protein